VDLQFKVEGIERLRRATKNAEVYFRDELVIALDASARHVKQKAVVSISRGQKSGRIYRVGGVNRRASAPGEAPANQTGRLVNSITTSVLKNTLHAVIYAGRGLANYARALEFGTAEMEARPFFFPAVESSRAWIQKRLAEAVNRAIKRSGK
jgi:HK97 gp10 family phage protein